MGIKFLRHIERTRLLLHLVDISGIERENPLEDFVTINKELEQYSKKLAEKKQIIVATKLDIKNEELYNKLKKYAEKNNLKIFYISSVTGEGIEQLLDYVSKTLKTIPLTELEEKPKQLYTLEEENNEFIIEHEKNIYTVKGKNIEKIIRRINIADNESLYYLHKNLVNLGIEDALKAQGIKEGDIVKIANYEFEWYE